MNFLAGRSALKRRSGSLLAGLLLLGMTSGLGSQQQQQHPSGPPQAGPDPMAMPDATNKKAGDDDAAMRVVTEHQAKMRNEERQKKLVSDTERLLALATKLHEDVAKTDKNILSLDVVKRADEIEKLAHNVKERMRDEQ